MASSPEEAASGPRMLLALMSALWLIGAGLMLCFIAALGTLACGTMCGTLIPIGMIVALVAIGGLVVAMRLVIGAIRRQLPEKLIRLALIADGSFVLLLVGVITLLGAA